MSRSVTGLGGMTEAELGDAVLLGHGLQLAVAVAHAAVAVAVVLAEEQLEHVTARQAHAAAVRVDLHLVDDGRGAGRLQRSLPVDLDHADAAHPGHVEIGVVAERRDRDADSGGGVEDRGAEGHLGLDAVDRDGDGGADRVGARRDHHAAALLRERGAVGLGRGHVRHRHYLSRAPPRGSSRHRRSRRGSTGRRWGSSARGRISRRPASWRRARAGRRGTRACTGPS